MQLTEYLTPDNRFEIITNVMQFTLAEFIEAQKRNNRELKNLIGQNIVLSKLDSFALVRLILLLDGVVQNAVLIPTTISQGDANRVISSSATPSSSVSIDDNNALHVNKIRNFKPVKQADGEIITRWCLPTSGTTGTPKLVVHTIESLTRTIVISQNPRHYRSVWGLQYEISRFAGMQVLLQAIVSQSTLVIPPNNGNFKQKIEFFSDNKVNSLSATPSYWRNLIMSGNAKQLNLTRITLGGEISDQNVLNALAKAFPKAKIIHIYASTEAGVGFTVSDKKEGFPKSYLEHGYKDMSLKVDKNGLLFIKNEKISQHYADKSLNLADEEGFVDTGDVVKICGDRVLFIGRQSGAINVGGHKVHPEELEKLLTADERVAMCRVYGKKNSIMGNLVIAEIVSTSASENFKSLSKDLKALCKSELESFKVPYKFVEKQSITISPNGKIKREII